MQIILSLLLRLRLNDFICILRCMSNLFDLFILVLMLLAFKLVTTCTGRTEGSLFGGRVLYGVIRWMLGGIFMCLLNFESRLLRNLRNLYAEFFDDGAILINNRDLLPLDILKSKIF